jgi:hypothetical protein
MGRGGKRGLTEAERQEITAALLARWERETQSLIRQARAGRGLSAGNGATAQVSSSANRSWPPEKAQGAPATGPTQVSSSVQVGARVARGGKQSRQGTSSARSTNAKPRPMKGPLPNARRSARGVRAEEPLAWVNPAAASWWARANSKPALKVDASQHVLAWWSCAKAMHPRWREYIDVVAQGRGRCPSCRAAARASGTGTARRSSRPVQAAPPKAMRSSATAGRKRLKPSPQPEPTPYERAFGVSALMRKLNPPEAQSDAWR